MGRAAATSIARIYADVNAKLGPSWHEYGELTAAHSLPRDSSLPDNLQVQWGSQDHYEIVRKVGRGKYSEVRLFSCLCHL
jgi:casein kinase II subunit alpha